MIPKDRPNGVTLSVDERILYVSDTFHANVQKLSGDAACA